MKNKLEKALMIGGGLLVGIGTALVIRNFHADNIQFYNEVGVAGLGMGISLLGLVRYRNNNYPKNLRERNYEGEKWFGGESN